MDNRLNLSNVSQEFLFMLELLKEHDEQQTGQFEKKSKEIDWNLFLKLAMHHRVFPILSSKINKLQPPLLPPHVSQSLSQHYKRNTFQMLYLCAEMEQVSRLLAEQHVQTLFLKGPVLAQELYGDLSLRTSSDLDFLIPIHHLERTENLLKEQGYQKDDYIETILNDWRWRHHHVTYIHPDKKIKLEIHWRLHPGPGKEPAFEELWKRKERSTLTDYPVYMLGKEDLFSFLVCHGARHGWSRLRWLMDIQQLVKQKLDWKTIQALFKEYHNPAVAGQALILASQLLNVPLLKEMQPLLSQNRSQRLAQEAVFYLETMINLHTDPVPEKVSKYHARHLFSLMSARQKCFFLASFLYPYPEDAQTLPLPKSFHFLYFPLRPFLWTWRKTRKPALS